MYTVAEPTCKTMAYGRSESVEESAVSQEEFMAADVLVVLRKQNPRPVLKSAAGTESKEGKRQIWMVTIPPILPFEDMDGICQEASKFMGFPLHDWIGHWDQKVNRFSSQSGMVCKELVNMLLKSPEETCAYIGRQSLLDSIWEGVPDRTILQCGGKPFVAQKTRIHGVLLVALTPMEHEETEEQQPRERYILSTELLIGAAMSGFRKNRSIDTLKRKLMTEWMNATEHRIDLVLNAIVHLHQRYVNLDTYELRESARKG